MRMLVVGAGATGGYFGGRLALAGRDVTFLVRGKRAAALRSEGMEIITPSGLLKLQPQIVEAGEITRPYDVILIAVKAFALGSVLEALAPAVGENTLIMPILNGMKHLEVLTERFGKNVVIGGLCKIAGTLDERGRIVQLSPLHEMTYGELDGSASERITRLDRLFQNAGFNARLSLNIISEMWEKWLLLASLGAITCLMRGNIGQVASAPGGDEFARAVIDEVLAVLVSVGYIRREEYLQQTIGLLTQKESVQTSSMYRDLMQGYEIEADQVIGDLVSIAGRGGLSVPLLRATSVNLSVYRAARDNI
ncbi:ketopantoate reductase family protein [Sodalis sp. dw_96]|uniref:ketopantoate reductase family protein n=1 Tax=Sodalis sp. dw_96 TaxID=2719794 RepID=UPI001BD5B1BD|nr:ketopantoate reductase family protein [Sodalis sp. dw_96]